MSILSNSSLLNNTIPNNSPSRDSYIQDMIRSSIQNKSQMMNPSQIPNATDYSKMFSPPRQRTVFSDIADELSKLNAEELDYITKDEGYSKAYTDMINSFSKYLFEKFQDDFYTTQYGQLAEQVLLSIRSAKDEYHKSERDRNNKNQEVLMQLQEQNRLLREQLLELSRSGNKTIKLPSDNGGANNA